MKVAANTAKLLRNVPLPDEVDVVHNNAAVLDMGSGSTRLGFAGDNAPRMKERTAYVKRPSGEDVDPSLYCFDKAYNSGEAMPVMHRGTVASWEGWEQLIERVDDMMLLSSTDCNTPLLLSEGALVPMQQRQKMAEILYEKHRVSAMNFVLSPVLALYASGLCTGVSVELGHDQCHVAPVYQGFSLFHATHCLNLGGEDLTALLAANSQQLSPQISDRDQEGIYTYLKERYGRAADSYSSYQEIVDSGRHVVEHVLPDGTVFQLGAERFTGPEVFFRPSLLPRMNDLPDETNVVSEVQLRTTSTPRGIHELIVDSIKKCDQDLQPYFYDNILLSGGASLYAGLPRRVEAEVQSLLPPSAERVRVTAEIERRDAAFVGGSILASLPTLQELWVTKLEYDEVGSVAVVRGCF